MTESRFARIVRRSRLAAWGVVLIAISQVPAARAYPDGVRAIAAPSLADPPTEVRALRRLEAHNERFNKHAWLEARTSFDTPGGFTYEIVSSRGSGLLISRVLRKALEREAEAMKNGETRDGALTTDNYEFTPAGTADGLVRVAIQPRRLDALLVQGSALMTSDADLVQLEGRLVKNPSFWTRNVRVVRRYARITGVRVPIAMSITSDVRLAGTSTFLMTYEYQQINGQSITPIPVDATAQVPR